MALQQPWAILLCRCNDDPNDPNIIRISDLYRQWETTKGAKWLSDNMNPAAANDNRTILELYNQFFTNAGAGTYNAVKYWAEMSHGTIDISGTQIFTCDLDIPKQAGLNWNNIFHQAKAALLQQHGVDWNNFPTGIAVSFQSDDGGFQGGGFDGGPGVNMDVRTVRNNGMEVWGQEMGHAFGLDHSRQDGSDEDYLDKWDTMSTWSPYALTADPNYGVRGIGINAWNMRSRNWLDESRVWHEQQGFNFDTKIELRPLHRHDLPGILAAELPPFDGPGGHNRYLVEFRLKEAWDEGIPRSAILVHRFDGNIGQFMGTHSYIMFGTNGQKDLAAGDVFISHDGTKLYSRMEVIDINEVGNTAIVRLSSFGNVQHIAASINKQDDLHLCAIDRNDGLWHTIRLANGTWPFPFGDIQQQTRLIGPNQGIGPTPKVACANNTQGDLHICAIDQNGGLWHTIRMADGSWPFAFGDVQAQARLVGPNPGIGVTPFVSCTTNQQGDLHVLAIDQNNGLWHTIRMADGNWPFAFGDVQGQTRLVGPNPGIGPTPFVACATNPQGDLHVLAIDQNGGLWHTIRMADGSWPFAFADVQAQTRLIGPNPGIGVTPFVACATNQQGDLHVLAIDQNNGLWHTIRMADGSWPFAFGDVQAQTRLVGPNAGIGPTPLVACATTLQGDLHICAVDQNGGLWHTIRTADGSWPFAFGDVLSAIL